MGTAEFVVLYGLNSLFWKWIISWGGAHWLEGWKAVLLRSLRSDLSRDAKRRWLEESLDLQRLAEVPDADCNFLSQLVLTSQDYVLPINGQQHGESP